jgi:hypothetical protein
MKTINSDSGLPRKIVRQLRGSNNRWSNNSTQFTAFENDISSLECQVSAQHTPDDIWRSVTPNCLRTLARIITSIDSHPIQRDIGAISGRNMEITAISSGVMAGGRNSRRIPGRDSTQRHPLKLITKRSEPLTAIPKLIRGLFGDVRTEWNDRC